MGGGKMGGRGRLWRPDPVCDPKPTQSRPKTDPKPINITSFRGPFSSAEFRVYLGPWMPGLVWAGPANPVDRRLRRLFEHQRKACSPGSAKWMVAKWGVEAGFGGPIRSVTQNRTKADPKPTQNLST